jgi:hypothetical protein
MLHFIRTKCICTVGIVGDPDPGLFAGSGIFTARSGSGFGDVRYIYQVIVSTKMFLTNILNFLQDPDPVQTRLDPQNCP